MPFTDGWYQGFGLYPGTFNMTFHNDSKQSYEAYDVFVDQEYVGQKMMANEYEHIADIEDFLRGRGFVNFSTAMEGDHYEIHVHDDGERQAIKDNLNMYFHNR
ncbi:hypothetical protein [Bacillus sp. 165]|uniref:hypothetical protein n=1 Tax=Bacillus sp. 165 TaxID=1529117 RepID=UPI001ADAD1D4|nr:hypothetical protein [Bacillus sp. 165]MBO9129103.1 hypothetical protein [Bacillus sp. 165]